jgi:DNA-directed RNA polymerase specialized sigma24 family protein
MAGESAVGLERHRRSGVVEALNREWCMLVRAHRETASRWAADYGVLFGCRSLDDVVQRVVDAPDAVLGALLAEVAKGDRVAARTVFQAMIGRLIRMAQRDYRAGVDDYLSALWCVITNYPLDRRPAKISANLSMDALKLVCDERRWLRGAEVVLKAPQSFLDPDFEVSRVSGLLPQCDGAAVLAAGHDLALLDTGTRELLHSVYIDGMSSAEAARHHRSTPGGVRVRCSKALSRLATHSLALLEAA